MTKNISASELRALRASYHERDIAAVELEIAQAQHRLKLLRLFAKYNELRSESSLDLSTGVFEKTEP